MKTLLVGINARYSHTNPAIRSLQAYASDPARTVPVPASDIVLYENHVNQPYDRLLRELADADADLYGFSCYLWNIETVMRLCSDLRLLKPGAILLLGGPEILRDASAEKYLAALPAVDMLLAGEGEESFHRLLLRLSDPTRSGDPGPDVPGLTWRHNGVIRSRAPGPPMEMDRIPFLYRDGFTGLENRLVYYESTRGCPCGCAYCLSANDRLVRSRPLPAVLEEIGFLAAAGVRTVKFVDRTFNADPDRSCAIWRYVSSLRTETVFHFEVAAHLADDASLRVLAEAPAGRIQLEAGIQSIHGDVLRAAGRTAPPEITLDRARRLTGLGNLDVHLDLIIGLPGETADRFAESFDAVYALAPGSLQVETLKVLPGTPMRSLASRPGWRFSPHPPYRLLSSDSLRPDEVFRLEDVARLTDVYYNSRAFSTTLQLMTKRAGSPYRFFEELACIWRSLGLFARDVSRNEAAALLLHLADGDREVEACLRADQPRLASEREWHGLTARRSGFGALRSDIMDSNGT
ncbi:MAG: B12-binding domain-containing radical SAM protein [Clostridia bacterium]|nr:B12-binding domain-containing radical SAM protein [Clostridia bacterium]